MDLGNIVYIVAVIGYFIYRAVSNKKAKDAEDGDLSETLDTPKSTSFEDLLREIREAQSPKRDQPKTVVAQEEILIPEGRVRPIAMRRSQAPSEKVEMDEEARFYKGAYSTAFQTVAEDGDSIYEGSFLKVESSRTNQKSNRYAQLLKNPQSLRDAIVINEILRPRHF